MASNESQIDKPQSGHPKRAELPDVNINTACKVLTLRDRISAFNSQFVYCLWLGHSVIGCNYFISGHHICIRFSWWCLRFVRGVFGSVNISHARCSLKNAFHQPNRMEHFALSYEELSLQVKSKLWVHYGHRYICTQKSLFGSRKTQILAISLVNNNSPKNSIFYQKKVHTNI